MAKAKKPKKERHHSYDPKLKVKGSFDDLINLSVGKKPQEKNEDKKKG